MNLKKGKFKIVEGTRVRMVSSKDTHIVEGAYGTVVNSGIRESEVRWQNRGSTSLRLIQLRVLLMKTQDM